MIWSYEEYRQKEKEMEIINRYGVAPPLTYQVAQGGHAMIYATSDPCIVAKVELQKGPGQLALLRKEQEFMRNFKGVPGLAYSMDVYWNIPAQDVKQMNYVYNVMYMPFYPLAVEDMTCPLISIALQLKSALQELHKRGLVHRDVNPGNIRGETSSKLVLIDFGLCAVESRLPKTKTKIPVGTPPFISESVIEGNKYTYRDDMVSATKVIHYLADKFSWQTKECPKDIYNLFLGDFMVTV